MNQDAFPLNKLDYIKGEPIDLAACKGKHAVVVEFWATWCPPCRSSIPHLTELAHKYPDVKFVGITNESKPAASKFVSDMGAKMDYAVACDPLGSTQVYMQTFQLQGIPAAVVVDRKGKMIWAGHPMEPAFEEALQKANKPVVNLSQLTEEELQQKPVKELKALARENGVDISQCVEKPEIVAALRKK